MCESGLRAMHRVRCALVFTSVFRHGYICATVVHHGYVPQLFRDSVLVRQFLKGRYAP